MRPTAHPEPTPFLPAGFLAWLERLELGARRVAPRGLRGRHRSRGLGGALEIADDRPYAPGDDLRAIDWAAYARLEQLLVRRFRRDQDLAVHVLVDLSASMEVGGRALFSRQLAFAIAFVALSGDDRVRLRGFARGRVHPAAAARGRRRSAALWRHAETLLPEPVAGDLPRSLAALAASRPAPGLAVVLSDLLPTDEDGAVALRRSLQRLRVAGLEPVVVRIAPHADRIVPAYPDQATEATQDAHSPHEPAALPTGAPRTLGVWPTTQDAHSPHEPAALLAQVDRTLGGGPAADCPTAAGGEKEGKDEGESEAAGPWTLQDAEHPEHHLAIGSASPALRQAVRAVAAEHAARARAACRDLDVAFVAVSSEATLREAVLAFVRKADPRISPPPRRGSGCSSGR